jgi:predicted solute-binding protein
MQILLDASFVTMPLTMAVTAGLVESPERFSLRDGLRAGGVGPLDAALLPAGEYGALQETHRIVPSLAVIYEREGPVVLRTPVRPDEVDRTPIRLIDTSTSGELLARATLDPFFGITPAGFGRDDVPDAQAVIVEGALALTPPEMGFNEDLARAWYILTAEPYVSHILVAPMEISAGDLAALEAAAETLRTIAETSRRAIRTRIVEATQLDRERLTTLYQATRWTLTQPDRRALLMLLQLGNKLGEVGPYVSQLGFAGEE